MEQCQTSEGRCSSELAGIVIYYSGHEVVQRSTENDSGICSEERENLQNGCFPPRGQRFLSAEQLDFGNRKVVICISDDLSHARIFRSNRQQSCATDKTSTFGLPASNYIIQGQRSYSKAK